MHWDFYKAIYKTPIVFFNFTMAEYKTDKASISEEEINSRIDLRNKARANKDYKEADKIRDELSDKGVLIEDKDGKTLWKFKWVKNDYIFLIQH